MDQEFICICFGNIYACSIFSCIDNIIVVRIGTIRRNLLVCAIFFYIIKIYFYIFTVRFNTIKQYFLALIFPRQRIQRISRKLFCIFVIRIRIHIKFQQWNQTFKFISAYCTDRNLKHILILRQHIILDLHLIMRQRRRKQQPKHQKQVRKYNSYKQHDIVAHILEDYTESESGKYFNLWT